MFAALRFLWNATRGHRFAPWRSPYLRWRVETYSGRRAETLTAKSVLGFLWATRGELLRFLVWTGEMQREARKLKTQALHESWRKEFRALKKRRPGMSDMGYSKLIAKMEIAQGRSAETIRKHMKGRK